MARSSLSLLWIFSMDMTKPGGIQLASWEISKWGERAWRQAVSPAPSAPR